MSKRLQEILRKNTEFEKETPYNFCDRWCKHCSHDKQIRCKVYHDEFEQRITCIAYGKEEYDLDITTQVMEKQYKEMTDMIEDRLEEIDIDFDRIDSPELEAIKEHIKFVEKNPLQISVEQYLKKAREFLKLTFYKSKPTDHKLISDFETLSWYHTLLPVKLNRALAGFHEPACDGEFALYDAIAQFQICKKAIKNSTMALRNIIKMDESLRGSVIPLLALLQNILSRIKLMEAKV